MVFNMEFFSIVSKVEASVNIGVELPGGFLESDGRPGFT
jgi:hypothetical protein